MTTNSYIPPLLLLPLLLHGLAGWPRSRDTHTRLEDVSPGFESRPREKFSVQRSTGQGDSSIHVTSLRWTLNHLLSPQFWSVPSTPANCIPTKDLPDHIPSSLLGTFLNQRGGVPHMRFRRCPLFLPAQDLLSSFFFLSHKRCPHQNSQQFHLQHLQHRLLFLPQCLMASAWRRGL